MLSTGMFAQNQSICGVVKDSETFQLVSGPSISIPNSILGAIGNDRTVCDPGPKRPYIRHACGVGYMRKALV